MPTKSTGKLAGGIKIPTTLTIKDLITIISVAISLTLAWGVFSTRIAILEKEVVTLRAEFDKNDASVEKLQDAVRRLETHQQDDELLIDQLFAYHKKPPPNRHGR